MDAKASGRNGLISSPMLMLLNMGVNCSYLQRNIFSQASIQLIKNMYYTFLNAYTRNKRATDL